MTSSGTYADGGFHLLACVVDRSSNTLTLIVDGGVETLQSTFPSGSTFVKPQVDVLIGARIPQAPDRFFHGEIDEVEIFDRALSVSEVEAMFAAGSAGKCMDRDNDGYLPPADCDDFDGCSFPGAPEICDTKDNDCDNTVDEDAMPPGPVSGVRLGADRSSINWSTCGAGPYDVVKGDLLLLQGSVGDFSTSLQICLEDDSTDTASSDTSSPLQGGFYYLVRGDGPCGPGTYDTGSQFQVGSRDTEIATSGQDCR